MVGIFAVSEKCRTQDGRGQNTAHVSELISGTWMSRNLSRGSESLGLIPNAISILFVSFGFLWPTVKKLVLLDRVY